MTKYSLNVKLPDSLYSIHFPKSVLLLTIILLLLIALPYPSPKPASAVGEALTISAPVTLSGTYGITATRFSDKANLAFYFEPSGTSVLSNITGNLSGNATTATNLTGLTTTVTKLNYLTSITGITGTGNAVLSASPTFTGTVTAPTGNFSGGVTINNGSPTIYFQDTDERSAMIHNNSNLLYILRGCAVNSTSWCAYNGVWPFYINLENNTSNFGGSVTATSDIRLKTNIEPLPENILEKVKKLRGVYFNWKTEADMGNNRQIGIIAQEVEKVFPELVGTGADGYKTFGYDRLGPILIEAVKEQQKEIDSLKSEVDNLKKEIKEIRLFLKK